MTSCPAGHQSASTDYCDTCGCPMRVVHQSATTAAPPTAPATCRAPQTVTCPHCKTSNHAADFFCKHCGYDFTTGSLPTTLPQAENTPATPSPASVAQPSGAREAAPEPPQPTLSSPAAPQPPSAPEQIAPRRSDWVAEVWVDPAWFALQEGEGVAPSPGPPTIVSLRNTTAMIGRTSASRGIHPEIDCGVDTAVSRSHAKLTTDGRRWWLEDLDSANGTFVGDATGTPPENPIPAGRKVEIDIDDRVWLGAWTRIVVRPATSMERDLS
ncbi:FHA domain-containing protein [Dermatophilus congolensis]|uniref:FHA domain-containing protein n=1 Tax=Dermatophilus congolensis TaxID=1863 RepID=UPI001AB0499E|nr:FHA domain-containing protein [Dermatophilus congolensis]MBO3159374.1 FHA domain-containing protein [Dermatophilus congolensis]